MENPIHPHVLGDRILPPMAKLLYLCLVVDFANQGYSGVTNKQMGIMLGTSPWYASEMLKLVEQLNLVKVVSNQELGNKREIHPPDAKVTERRLQTSL